MYSFNITTGTNDYKTNYAFSTHKLRNYAVKNHNAVVSQELKVDFGLFLDDF